MNTDTRTARVVAPIPFVTPEGHEDTIPLGPCLIEALDADRVDVAWGDDAEESAVLQRRELEWAESTGALVVLD